MILLRFTLFSYIQRTKIVNLGKIDFILSEFSFLFAASPFLFAVLIFLIAGSRNLFAVLPFLFAVPLVYLHFC
ncbi:hypothetical protein [Bacillus sp. AFS017336]|uniref:hypothetical protein n=1 Tax=Bacillus sp. AFS017336 TaxID=2033489 RepID=UPI001155D053|nr:hypothetical protein [Bacillus sp. AFS017336]